MNDDDKSSDDLSIIELLNQINEPHRSACLRLLERVQIESEQKINTEQDRSHQAHTLLKQIEKILNITASLYETMSMDQHLPFQLSDALTVVYLHAYQTSPFGDQADGVILSQEQKTALQYIETYGANYQGPEQETEPLAAFCYLSEFTSARTWSSSDR